MSDQPEPLSAVLAEMRREGALSPRVLALADRIEAAAEREREAYCDLCKEKDAAYDRLLLERDRAIQSAATGNVGAMRDLLEKIRHEYGWGRIGCRTCVSSEADVERVSDLFEKQIDAALAAPARNCDRFFTAKKAMRAFDEMCEQTPSCRNDKCEVGQFRKTVGGPGCVPGWLFATMKEKETENG